MKATPMTQSEREVLIKWLEGPFKKACNEDVKRLQEAIWMLKIGHDTGDSAIDSMSVAIAAFVEGLIRGTTPITVTPDSN